MNLPIRGYNESLIVYVLAAASPTHPIAKSVCDNGWAAGEQHGQWQYVLSISMENCRGFTSSDRQRGFFFVEKHRDFNLIQILRKMRKYLLLIFILITERGERGRLRDGGTVRLREGETEGRRDWEIERGGDWEKVT